MQTFENFSQQTPPNSLPDTTSPVFAGIQTLTAHESGGLRATWNAATDDSNVQYDVFIKAQNATNLIGNSVYKALSTFGTSIDIFNLADGSVIIQGVEYFVYVQARDLFGNVDDNEEVLSAVPSGISSNNLLDLAAQLKSIANAIGGQLIGEVQMGSEIVGVIETDIELEAIIEDQIELYAEIEIEE